MIVPLVILGGLSVVGGWLWWPGFMPLTQAFPHWLETSVVVKAHEGEHHALEITLALVSVSIALGGIFLARLMYRVKPEMATQLSGRFREVHRTLWNKYWVDELYQATAVNGTLWLCRISARFDNKVIDGLVHACAWTLRLMVFIYGLFDKIVVDGLVNAVANVTAGMGGRMRRMQTGQIQTYLSTLAGVLIVLSMVWMSFLS
jgi:NADH:ubiquinone oxidoreductase subunit 5 (subunit L)/multisubunit Na+/H+ antiporter MnhA subunit